MAETKQIDANTRFGRLVALCRAGSIGSRAAWRCRCDCGSEIVTTGRNLRRGICRSCGCIGAEWSKAMGACPAFIAKRAATQVKHGHKRRSGMSIEYKTWLGIKRRCTDHAYKDFPMWGGRGIRVCARWDESFEAFLADMGPRPSPRHQIDRMNPNGNYEPGNCRWVTPQVQGAENKRNNLGVNGKRHDIPIARRRLCVFRPAVHDGLFADQIRNAVGRCDAHSEGPHSQ